MSSVGWGNQGSSAWSNYSTQPTTQSSVSADVQLLQQLIQNSGLPDTQKNQLVGETQSLGSLINDPTESGAFQGELAQLVQDLCAALLKEVSPSTSTSPHTQYGEHGKSGGGHSGYGNNDSYQKPTTTQSSYVPTPTSSDTPAPTSSNGTSSAGVSGTATPQAGTSSLYPNGTPQPSDVQQGETGDCGFVSQLAELAKDNPSAITNMISSDGNGGYNVQLYNNGQKQTVDVSAADIADTTKLSHADGQQGGKADWSTVIEAAATKMHGDLSGIDPGDAQGMLTGTKGNDLFINAMQYSNGIAGSDVASKIATTLSSGGMVSAGAPNNATTSNGQQIVGDHEYAVTAINGDQVTVRNPWGSEDPNSGTDGTITMSMSDFNRIFNAITVN